MPSLKQTPSPKPDSLDIVCSHFSKSEAAQLIAKGYQHVHSTELGERDACYQITLQKMHETSIHSYYPWEGLVSTESLILKSSRDRLSTFEKILKALELTDKPSLSHKLSTVYEELITNAIYHAYEGRKGKPKYERSQPAQLADKEAIEIRFGGNQDGIFLSITDKGDQLEFETIAHAFNRCYSLPEIQMETKKSGAGLGLYMIFETVTHLKIEIAPGQGTEFSCWLAKKRRYDPKLFSFNYFNAL